MAVPAGHFQVSYRGDMAPRKTAYQKGRLVLLGLLLVVIPFVVSSHDLNIITAIALTVPGALALSILTGLAGQISLGNAAFLGIGATTAAIMGQQLHMPFPVVLIAAGLVAGAIGVLVGIPSLRVRGLYLIIATLALHHIIAYAIQRVQEALVGPGGFILPAPTIGPLEISSGRSWYAVLVVFACIVTMIHVNLARSRVGRAWLAIRDRDMAAEIVGVPVSRYKITVFAATSAIIGIQGGLLAYYIGAVSYEMFPLTLALSYIAMVIIGGLGSHLGAIYGAVFVTALPYVLTAVFSALPAAVAARLNQSAFDVQAGIYGLMVIVVLLVEPRGIDEVTRRVREYFMLWPFSRARLADEES